MSSESGFDYFRTLVSGKKKRFIQDGFNLDLSYITQNILAMGYPAESIHKTFRNDINDVYNFFEKYHSGHWKILNVAMEISYKSTKVGGNVIVMGFEDHTPPPFLLLLDIVKVMDTWLGKDERNVMAVHCKAGKGRTGTVISSYLIYKMKQSTPDLFYSSDSILFNTISFFNSMRANNSECVTVPSQKRYVGYYIQYLRDQIPHSLLITPPKFKIISIDIIGTTIQNFNIEIHLNYNPNIRDLPVVLRGSNSNIINYSTYYRYLVTDKNIITSGDTKIKFNSLDSHQCIFRFLFHTAFLPIGNDTSVENSSYTVLYFQKDNLDGGNGGCFNDPRYKNDFAIRLTLEYINNNNNDRYNNSNRNSIENINNNTEYIIQQEHQQQQNQILQEGFSVFPHLQKPRRPAPSIPSGIVQLQQQLQEKEFGQQQQQTSFLNNQPLVQVDSLYDNNIDYNNNNIDYNSNSIDSNNSIEYNNIDYNINLINNGINNGANEYVDVNLNDRPPLMPIPQQSISQYSPNLNNQPPPVPCRSKKPTNYQL